MSITTDEVYRLTPKGCAYAALMEYIQPELRMQAVEALWAEVGSIVDSQPDLLAACRGLLDAIHDSMTHAAQAAHAEQIDAAKAAISKAKGGAACAPPTTADRRFPP